MQHLLPQETQDIPDPAGPPASLIYISLQPIDEDAIDVGRADENTDGCIGHDRLFTSHFNIVCRLLLEKKYIGYAFLPGGISNQLSPMTFHPAAASSGLRRSANQHAS